MITESTPSPYPLMSTVGSSRGTYASPTARRSFSFAKGQPSSSKAQSADFTATLLQHPGGRLLVAVIGLVIIGIGIYHVVKGWTREFLTDLRKNPGILATRLGVVVMSPRASLALVGVLFVTAA